MKLFVLSVITGFSVSLTAFKERPELVSCKYPNDCYPDTVKDSFSFGAKRNKLDDSRVTRRELNAISFQGPSSLRGQKKEYKESCYAKIVNGSTISCELLNRKIKDVVDTIYPAGASRRSKIINEFFNSVFTKWLSKNDGIYAIDMNSVREFLLSIYNKDELIDKLKQVSRKIKADLNLEVKYVYVLRYPDLILYNPKLIDFDALRKQLSNDLGDYRSSDYKDFASHYYDLKQRLEEEKINFVMNDRTLKDIKRLGSYSKAKNFLKTNFTNIFINDAFSRVSKYFEYYTLSDENKLGNWKYEMKLAYYISSKNTRNLIDYKKNLIEFLFFEQMFNGDIYLKMKEPESKYVVS